MITEYQEQLVEALDHIERTARRSFTQTRRLRWIATRAHCAVEGNKLDWKEAKTPKMVDSKRENNLLAARLRNSTADTLAVEKLLRDMFEAFYDHGGSNTETMEYRAIEAAGEYLHEKVSPDGQFPDEEDQS